MRTAQRVLSILVWPMTTALSGEPLRHSGPRGPYAGMIGVIAEGARADLLLVNGNPLEDFSILRDPETSLGLITNDGVIYENTFY